MAMLRRLACRRHVILFHAGARGAARIASRVDGRGDHCAGGGAGRGAAPTARTRWRLRCARTPWRWRAPPRSPRCARALHEQQLAAEHDARCAARRARRKIRAALELELTLLRAHARNPSNVAAERHRSAAQKLDGALAAGAAAEERHAAAARVLRAEVICAVGGARTGTEAEVKCLGQAGRRARARHRSGREPDRRERDHAALGA